MEDEKIEHVAKCLMSGLPSGHQIYESPHTQCKHFLIPAILPHHKGRKMILYKDDIFYIATVFDYYTDSKSIVCCMSEYVLMKCVFYRYLFITCTYISFNHGITSIITRSN